MPRAPHLGQVWTQVRIPNALRSSSVLPARWQPCIQTRTSSTASTVRHMAMQPPLKLGLCRAHLPFLSQHLQRPLSPHPHHRNRTTRTPTQRSSRTDTTQGQLVQVLQDLVDSQAVAFMQQQQQGQGTLPRSSRAMPACSSHSRTTPCSMAGARSRLARRSNRCAWVGTE